MRYFSVPVTASVVILGIHVTISRAAEEVPYAQPDERIVIPFDFQSRFDDGRYGRMVGDMIWKKLDGRGRFVIPESMLDVRDWSQRRGMIPDPEMPLAEMQQIIRDDFGAHIGIWGRVERVAGHEFDAYDLWINVADFAADRPRVIHQVKARTKTVSEIPHVHVKAALDRLYDVQPEEANGPDPNMEKRWREAPNLVTGEFEQTEGQGPLGWDPLPQHVRLVADRSDSEAVNHVVRFQFPENIAATSGVLYYSDYFPVEEGATYRFECRWRSSGSAAKVFIKCYDELRSKYRTEKGQAPYQRREVYRSQQNLKGQARLWNVHTEDFTPKHTQFTPRWGRIMLYAYWPAGTVDWDDIILKRIASTPEDSSPKVQRPSLETKVLAEELQHTD